MAIIKAFRAYVPTRNSDTYRITIYDLAASDVGAVNLALYGYQATASTVPKPIDVIHESVSIDYDASTDTIHSPIIGSRLEMTCLIQDDFSAYLIGIINARKEGEIAVKVERHDGGSTALTYDVRYDDFWIGCLSPEGITYDLSDLPREINLIFTDGLSLLRDVPYQKTDGTPYYEDSVYETMRTQIGNCLSHLPHIDLFTDVVNAPFFVEQLDMYHWNHVNDTFQRPFSILDKSGTNQKIWYDFRMHENPFNRKQRLSSAGSTCYEVLEDIMTAFGVSLFQWLGAWMAVSPFLEDGGSAPDQDDRAWKADKRSMIDPAYQDSASTSISGYLDGFPNRIDYRDAVILQGSNISYFNGVRGVSYTHTKGGAPLAMRELLPVTIHGTPFNANEDYWVPPEELGGSTGVSQQYGTSFPLNNSEMTVTGGQQLVIKGRVVMDSQLTSSDIDWVGAQPILSFKVKVGDQYLSQDVDIVDPNDINSIEDFGRIHIALGNPISELGFDVTTWRPIEISSDVGWTTTDTATFDIPFLIPGQMYPEIDTIEHSDGENVRTFPVGLNTRRHESEAARMRFRWSDRRKENDLVLEIITPELPGDETDVYTGLEIDVSMTVLANTNTLYAFTYSGAPYNNARIHNFRVLVGENKDEEDILYIATSDDAKGLEVVDGGETLVASRLTDYWGDLGVIAANSPGHIADGSEVDSHYAGWFSQAASGEDPTTASDGKTTMEIVAQEHLALRKEMSRLFNLQLLVHDHHLDLPRPLRRMLIETGSTDACIHILKTTYNLMAGQFDVLGFEIARVGSGISGTTSVDAADIHRKGPKLPPGPMPNSKANKVSGTTTVDFTKLDNIYVTGGNISGFNFGANTNVIHAEVVETDQDYQFMTAVEKAQHLDNTECAARITRDAGTGDIVSFDVHTGSKPLTADEVNDTSTTNKFATQSQLDAIDALPSDILRKTSTTIGDGTDTYFHVASGANGFRVSNFLTYTPSGSASNVTMSAIWNLDNTIATTLTTTSNLPYIQDFKVRGYNSTTTRVDVDIYQLHHLMAGSYAGSSCPATYGYACNALTLSAGLVPNDPTHRTGQSGVHVVTIDSDGLLDEVTDGVAGTFLKTDGSGNLSWGKTQAGWHGSEVRIKVMPHEWTMNDDYNRAPIMVEDDITNTLGIKLPSNASEAYAMIAIPDTFKATHVQVYASASTASAVTAYSYNHTSGAIVSKGSGDFNSSIDITDINSGATSNVCIKIAPGSPTTLIYGADITIAKV